MAKDRKKYRGYMPTPKSYRKSSGDYDLIGGILKGLCKLPKSINKAAKKIDKFERESKKLIETTRLLSEDSKEDDKKIILDIINKHRKLLTDENRDEVIKEKLKKKRKGIDTFLDVNDYLYDIEVYVNLRKEIFDFFAENINRINTKTSTLTKTICSNFDYNSNDEETFRIISGQIDLIKRIYILINSEKDTNEIFSETEVFEFEIKYFIKKIK